MSAACRSCGAAIEWAVTSTGARIPLDLNHALDGNIRAEYGPEAATAIVGAPGSGTRRSHFASCPNADEHRKRGES